MLSYQEYLSAVEAALVPSLESIQGIPKELLSAMSYSLSAGGKRLRPVLLLAACNSHGGKQQDAIPFACALEMIHTYSLIHDDLPAMDNDDLRRGKPSNHVVYGEAMAILAGDGLLSAAFQLMLQAASSREDNRGVRAAEAIARRCGVGGMVAGQALDISAGEEPLSEANVRTIHLRKTADLLTAPMEAGLLLAGAPTSAIRAGISYGQHLGLCFQMVDDLLDVVGSRKELGKATGQDAENGKFTWTALHGVDGTRKDALEEAQAAASAAAQLGQGADFFSSLALELASRIR